MQYRYNIPRSWRCRYVSVTVKTKTTKPSVSDRVSVRTGRSSSATVDAYSGEVTLYQWDEDDPIVDAWMEATQCLVQHECVVGEATRSGKALRAWSYRSVVRPSRRRCTRTFR